LEKGKNKASERSLGLVAKKGGSKKGKKRRHSDKLGGRVKTLNPPTRASPMGQMADFPGMTWWPERDLKNGPAHGTLYKAEGYRRQEGPLAHRINARDPDSRGFAVIKRRKTSSGAECRIIRSTDKLQQSRIKAKKKRVFKTD